MGGALVVVATPIGNLQDITLRAIETLKAVDLIACEDTRHSAILLKAHGIATPTTSYHSYTGPGKTARLIEQLRGGKRIALITDAGLPGVSDPGASLVQAAIAAGVPVEVIPGATAALMGLVLSGFPADRFVFEGFLPVKAGRRLARLRELRALGRTVVIYEGPHRVPETLAAIREVFGPVEVVLARELTKQFEEIRRGPPEALLAAFGERPIRGEVTLIIPPVRIPSE